MAHTKQGKKRIRQIGRRTEVNRSRLSRVRSFTRAVEDAIKGGDRAAAEAALKAAQPVIMKGAGSGVVHRNTAARKISRLATRINAMPS